MDKTTPISSIMTTNVITISPEDRMDKARDIFQKHQIHHIPVTDNGKVVGIISHSDYLRLYSSFLLFNEAANEIYNDAIMKKVMVKDIMTKQVAKLQPTDTVELAAGYFRENLFHAIPVVDGENKLVGIITTYDLLNFAFSDN